MSNPTDDYILVPELAQLVGTTAATVRTSYQYRWAWLPTPVMLDTGPGRLQVAWPRAETLAALQAGQPAVLGPAGWRPLPNIPHVWVRSAAYGPGPHVPHLVRFDQTPATPEARSNLLDDVEGAILRTYGCVRVVDSVVHAPGTYPLAVPFQADYDRRRQDPTAPKHVAGPRPLRDPVTLEVARTTVSRRKAKPKKSIPPPTPEELATRQARRQELALARSKKPQTELTPGEEARRRAIAAGQRRRWAERLAEETPEQNLARRERMRLQGLNRFRAVSSSSKDQPDHSADRPDQGRT